MSWDPKVNMRSPYPEYYRRRVAEQRAKDIADENAYWDREWIRWVLDLENTDWLKKCSVVEMECWFSIAEAHEAFYP